MEQTDVEQALETMLWGMGSELKERKYWRDAAVAANVDDVFDYDPRTPHERIVKFFVDGFSEDQDDVRSNSFYYFRRRCLIYNFVIDYEVIPQGRLLENMDQVLKDKQYKFEHIWIRLNIHDTTEATLYHGKSLDVGFPLFEFFILPDGTVSVDFEKVSELDEPYEEAIGRIQAELHGKKANTQELCGAIAEFIRNYRD